MTELRINKNNENIENTDVTIDEMETAINSIRNSYAPSPEEKTLKVFIKKVEKT